MKQIRAEIETIRRQNQGKLTPALVLAFAENHRRSAIARKIQERGLWDDAEAARMARLSFCQHLIIRVRVRILTNGEPKSYRAYINTIAGRSSGSGYAATVDLIGTKQGRQEILDTALHELKAFRRKFSDFRELADVCAAIRNVERLILDKQEAQLAA